MDGVARENLRKGLDLFWKSFFKKKVEHKNLQEASAYLEKIEQILNQAEGLLMVEKVREAAEVALRAGDLLGTLDIRCGIAFFRSANKAQQESNPNDPRVKENAKRAVHLFDQAEAYLDEGKIKEAKDILIVYHREKVKRGLAGPIFF